MRLTRRRIGLAAGSLAAGGYIGYVLGTGPDDAAIGQYRATGGGDDLGDRVGGWVDDDGDQPATEVGASEEEARSAAPREPTAGVFDDFTDPDRWRVIGGTRREHPAGAGTSFEVTEADSRFAIVREFDRPVDLSALRPELVVAVDGGHLRPWIRYVDTNGNQLAFRFHAPADVPSVPNPAGMSTVDGEPDLGSITEVRIDDFLGDETRTVHLDELRMTPRPEPGIVLLQFDDSLETDYTRGLPILEEHEMAASTMINPGYLGREVGGNQRLSVEQVDALAESGWDVCSHGMNHGNLRDLDEEGTRAEIAASYDWLVDHGYGDGARYFAYPYAAYDGTALDVVAEFHDVAFTAGYSAHGSVSLPYLTPRAVADATEATENIREIDRTIAYGGISTIFYHQLTDERETAFRETVEYLAARRADGDVRVLTVSAAEDELLTDQL